MTRRLLKAKAGRGLYLNSAPGVADWVEWLPLPPAHNVDPAQKLLAQTSPQTAALPGGLYGNDASREADRRRRADQALEAAGLKPRNGW